MDPTTYGRLVERGGYATGGIVRAGASMNLRGEWGPELIIRYSPSDRDGGPRLIEGLIYGPTCATDLVV